MTGPRANASQRRILYIDCYAGIAGDMMIGALLDLGLPEAHLRARLALLGPLDYELEVRRAARHGIVGTDVQVHLDVPLKATGAWSFTPVASTSAPFTSLKEHGHGRRYREIRALIGDSGLSDLEKRLALAIFDRLAVAEGKLHGISPDEVHFHEVGGVDAIVDITSAAIGLAWLAPDEVVCAPLPVPRGTVKCAHGTMPLPAPATLELMVGAEVTAIDGHGEWVTPTGAAIATTLATRYGTIPSMAITAIGYGVGDRDPPSRANLLRLIVGTAPSAELASDVVLETNLDDSTGEAIGYLTERLLAEGALDVWVSPIVMKKGRPGVTVSVLTDPGRRPHLERLLLSESSAIGLRRVPVERYKLARRIETVESTFGPIRVKVAFEGETILNRAPEYEDCRRAAEAHRVPLKDVFADVLRTMGKP
ncbi:MAG: nickel pincer cofactor biosynthesis protein LarC [Myxococcales bacterium]|nr:nickel pincer cofactor biosynthesis protein LarC [Myxococcales bacterium]